MKSFKVGQEVFCAATKRKGKITKIKSYNWTYPIVVDFEDGSTSLYTYDGRFSTSEEVVLT